MYVYIYIYIYIEREREAVGVALMVIHRAIKNSARCICACELLSMVVCFDLAPRGGCLVDSVYIYIYIYIYMYVSLSLSIYIYIYIL